MSKKVMVIEDCPDIRSLMKIALELEGHEVISASNGQEALEVLDTFSAPPDLILLDLMMPVMNGFEFRKKQLQDPRIAGIPVIILTADSNYAKNPDPVCAAGYIKKPMDLEVLLDTVSRASPSAA